MALIIFEIFMSSVKRILVVDDDKFNRKVLEGLLRSFGYDPVLAESGPRALEIIDESIDLVLLDIMMPEMDGYAVARAIRATKDVENVPIIVVTTLQSKEDRLTAVEAGANDFITKPIDLTELKVRSASLLRMKESQDEVKRYQAELEEKVSVRTQALELAMENLKQSQQATRHAYLETIHCLARAAEYKDDETGNHIKRMSYYSKLMAERSGMSAAEVEEIVYASPMHDVGKIGIPDSVLLKPGKLDPQEWVIMKTHTTIGSQILSKSTSELMETASIIALSHHERWDGSGYPNGLAGEDIPIQGRICALADVFDALTSKRTYKDAFSVEKSVAIMEEGRGSHFDPELFDLFRDNFDEIIRIKDEFSD
jgi:putative two-component system response regulator